MLAAWLVSLALAAPDLDGGRHPFAMPLPVEVLREALADSLPRDRPGPRLDAAAAIPDPRPTLSDTSGWYAVRVEPWLEDTVQGVWLSGQF